MCSELLLLTVVSVCHFLRSSSVSYRDDSSNDLRLIVWYTAEDFFDGRENVSAVGNLCMLTYWRSKLSERSVSPPLVSRVIGAGD